MKRSHIPLKTQLASALLALGDIPYLTAKAMTADEMRSLYHFDHNMFAAHGGGDHFSNLKPMLIQAHRKKTAKTDIPAIAKGKRIQRKQAEHMAAMDGAEAIAPWKKHLWPSRPFPKKAKR